MKESEIQFQTLADNLPQLTWLADASGKLYWYNRAFYDYTGLHNIDIDKFDSNTLLPGEDAEASYLKYVECIRTGQTFQNEVKVRGADGIYREIVRAHHGEIWAESKLGIGSTFVVRLPLLKG